MLRVLHTTYQSHRSWMKPLIITAFYLSVFIVFTDPFIGYLATHIIGKDDALQFAWNGFNFQQSIASGNLFFTETMFHPWGAETLMHAGGLLCNIVALPFSNKTLIVNCFITVHFLLSGYGAYRLSRHIGTSEVFAVIIGFIFAFSPYKMARLDAHHNLVMTGFIPFFILWYLQAFRFSEFKCFPPIKSTKFLLLALFAGFLQALTDFVVMFHLLYFAAFWMLYAYISKLHRRFGTFKAGITIATIIVLLHFLTQLLVTKGFNDSAGLWWGGYWSDFIRPDGSAVYHALTGDWLHRALSRYNMGLESQVFIGYSMVITFTIAIILWTKNHKAYSNELLFTLVCIILVAIPEPLGYQRFYSPFAFLHFIPGITELRCPERIFGIGYLCLSIFAFIQIDHYILRWNSSIHNIVALIFFAAVFAEYYPVRYQLTDTREIPDAVKMLRYEPAEAVLVYPFGLRDGYFQDGHYDMKHPIYQMYHKKKQLGGYISRISEQLRQKYRDNVFIRDLVAMQQTDTTIRPRNYSGAIDSLNFESALILEQHYSARGALFLDSVLINNGYIRKHCADGYLLVRYQKQTE